MPARQSERERESARAQSATRTCAFYSLASTTINPLFGSALVSRRARDCDESHERARAMCNSLQADAATSGAARADRKLRIRLAPTAVCAKSTCECVDCVRVRVCIVERRAFRCRAARRLCDVFSGIVAGDSTKVAVCLPTGTSAALRAPRQVARASCCKRFRLRMNFRPALECVCMFALLLQCNLISRVTNFMCSPHGLWGFDCCVNTREPPLH